MYSKKEETLLKEQFWTALGIYMKPILSAGGEKINWINYKTGQKGIRFIMQADTKTATVAIEITHTATQERVQLYEKFLQLKKIFSSTVEGQWNWQPEIVLENGSIAAIISTGIQPVNILNRNDWPQLISFFKNNMLALDNFWSENKFAFEM